MPISSLNLRLLSGFILGPLFVLAIYFGGILFQAVVAIAFGLSVKEWIDMTRQGKRVIRDSILGIAYFIIAYASFFKLRLEMDEGMFLTVVLFLTVMIGDVAAYFTGRFFKGPKLLPSISPNKTWAGLIGGMLGSVAFILLANTYQPFLPLNIAIVAGLSLAVVGQIGDLIISMYKRRVHVKDTGHLIPGHGGILDRIDSLLLATPFFLIVIVEFSP
jgi:phosphatidate cytidylyltransferase